MIELPNIEHNLEKHYQPLILEKKWYQFWEKSGYFQPKPADQAYCIMLPPPNVTGTLHMGHAFQDTIMDALIRYHRMMGYQTLWQGGTDHAGIATQMVVERQLNQQGTTKYDLGRESFVKKVWEWKAHSGNIISSQMRRLGTSVDWTRERFTMDEGLSDAVRKVFVQLYDEGLIYRGKRLVNWDPKLHTAVSDLEVITSEENGSLWHIRYPIKDSSEFVVVATTRPETLLGDMAVAVHPTDPRYQHLIGKFVSLPLCDRDIPIIADEYVDPEFGTGCVKITPAHDFNDHEIGKKHHLPMMNIFTIDAVLNESVPKPYQGLERFEARTKIINDLTALSLMEKIEPYVLKVPRGDRSGEIVEPYLTDQWFVHTLPLAEAAIEVVRNGEIQFVPENWENTYFDWMTKIQDWCISRQLWWGHRIPAWYDADNKIYVGLDEKSVREKYNLKDDVPLMQDPDVLDTWFSSALWPFSTLGWGQEGHNPRDLEQYYPTNVLVTGFDIIFFWVARMIMMGLKFTGKIPFKQVYITGLILDPSGQKMSKTKGNILDPIDLIDGIGLDDLIAKRIFGLMQPAMAKKIEEETRKQFPEGIPSYGTDALRFTLAAIASPSRHIRFDMTRIEANKHFCNKIWNATRFVLMNVGNQQLIPADKAELSLSDRWIQSVWQNTKQEIHQHFTTYRFDLLAQTLYDFIWNIYCDWYVELYKAQPKTSASSYTLVAVLEEVMRAMHPIMPYITEEIWQILHPLFVGSSLEQNQSIMIQPYPLVEQEKMDQQALDAMVKIQGFITGVRTLRSEMNINPAMQVAILCRTSDSLMQSLVNDNLAIIQPLAKVKSIEWIAVGNEVPNSSTKLIEQVEVFISLEGLIDKEAELKRIDREMGKLLKEIEGCERKLNDPNYISKAPVIVVEKEKERLAIAQTALAKLKESLEKIKAI